MALERIAEDSSGSGAAGLPVRRLAVVAGPGSVFFRRGRAQVGRGEIMMIGPLVPPTPRLAAATLLARDRGRGRGGRVGVTGHGDHPPPSLNPAPEPPGLEHFGKAIAVGQFNTDPTRGAGIEVAVGTVPEVLTDVTEAVYLCELE